MSDDLALNIKFVELVEMHPCIYDYRRDDHSKRDVVEKAWSAIACELKLSGSQCKEKWKNLRTAFARSMKKPPSGSGARRIKDYYLKDVMQFITPYMKSKLQQGNLPREIDQSLNEDNDSESEAEMTNDDQSEQEITASVRNSQRKQTAITTVVMKSQGENPQPPAQFSDTAGMGPSVKRPKIYKPTLNEADKCLMEYVKSKTAKTNSAINKPNADLHFLKSLLPDVAKLTDYQKRQFKKRTLELLDELLCDGPSSSPVYSTFSNQPSPFFSKREYGEQQTPVRTYIHSPDMSDSHDRQSSLQYLLI